MRKENTLKRHNKFLTQEHQKFIKQTRSKLKNIRIITRESLFILYQSK